ncbi:enoyl-CoA hydratase [Edaphobacillus lindanitolerans]|uniref:Enoyl-CoA hydratase/carnithine racemase n=1 Tax=Edaphobacillus lindanitolerans TaxID=550447 RepID=A0A1U7PMH5_9BACI|nr:enoyl-CoA hydratase [Edaphobacillus lindanitolerans]SIT90850.1 Enoyl-CoA hydratase/carnithine racemase [Edaphobacillus lindanitolerans]
MAYETIRLEREGRMASVVLNRPNAMNAMNDVMMKELAEAFEELKDDREVQLVIIRGGGRAFSAGGDIKQMTDPDNPMDIRNVMADVSRLAEALYTLPQITIAAISGASAGLGFSMALACDVILAEESSKLAMNFIGIGLVPDGAGHFFLKERIGVPKAKQLIWTGEVMQAEKAKALGLIDEIVPDGKAAKHAGSMAGQLLQTPIAAMIASKGILHTAKLEELRQILRLESDAQQAMRQTADHLEGITAFIEKRKPIFKGE